jgi:hypothetical protein
VSPATHVNRAIALSSCADPCIRQLRNGEFALTHFATPTPLNLSRNARNVRKLPLVFDFQHAILAIAMPQTLPPRMVSLGTSA